MAHLSHLLWIPSGLLVGFLAPFLFADLLNLPQDFYYLIYFVIVAAFFGVYVKKTALDLQECITTHIGWAFATGVLGGMVMMQGVLMRPQTAKLEGIVFWWELFWRGFVYGTIDGILLFAFPWLVVWRAFEAGKRNVFAKIGTSVIALLCIVSITTTYHLGYRDFRSEKIIQPAIGSSISSVPTLLTANPLASVISHIFLHIAAVVHSPYPELFLPPHRANEELMNVEKPFVPPEVEN
ncbi:MAG: hypothetical protein ACOCW2_00475 [Chitinivibrionales bacterium]